MKNIKVLYEPEEIREYMRSRFQTELFRTEMDKPGSFVNKIVERAAKYPMFVYEFSDHPSKDTPDKDKTEWAHFGAWMGGITERDYESPAVSDTYYLHELYHKGFMSYANELSFEGWKEKIFRNELNASMASELELYFHHPEFRKHTFDFEIFADRMLQNPKFMERWKQDPWEVRDEVRIKRRELMLRENKDDPVEYWIHKFAQQNEAWASIWSRRYEQIEAHMEQLHHDIDEGMPRKQAMDKFMSWLTSDEITKGTEIPFPHEAEAFAGVYRLNSRHYQESISRGDMSQENAVTRALEKTYGKKGAPNMVGHDIEKLSGMPNWSERHGMGYQVLPATAGYKGGFIWHYAVNQHPLTKHRKPKLEDIDILIQERNDKGPNGEIRYGAFGGFVSQDKKEQGRDGAVRENAEELLDENGRAVIPVQQKELQIIDEYTDYRSEPPVFNTGYSREMSPEEHGRAVEYVTRMNNDPAYAAAVKAASHDEVKNVYRMSLKEALALPEESFTHPHEHSMLHQMAENLMKQQPKAFRLKSTEVYQR